MKLRTVILSKSDLAALPRAERSLVLLLGHASNEINVLSKLILMMTRKDAPPSQIANNVEAGQICVLVRVLVGQLHEAWELFRKRVQRNRPLHDKYVSLLDAEGEAKPGADADRGNYLQYPRPVHAVQLELLWAETKASRCTASGQSALGIC